MKNFGKKILEFLLGEKRFDIMVPNFLWVLLAFILGLAFLMAWT